MPRLLCCLSLALSLLLAACAAPSTGSHARRRATSSDDQTAFVPTRINAPPAAPQAPTGPARTMTFSNTPASPPPTSAPEEHPLAPAAPPVAPTRPAFGPIVMGAPLPGQPTPMPSPAAPPAPIAPIAPAPAMSAPPAANGAMPAPRPDAVAPSFPTMTEHSPATFENPDQLSGPPESLAGLSWGASAKDAQGMTVHEVNKALSIVTYIWPTGPNTIMGAPIRDAFYEFFQDRFYHVWIDLDGMAAYKTALAGLTTAYGPPSEQNPAKYYNAWNLGEVNVYCVYHPAENEADVSYFYQPIYKQLDASRKAAREKGHTRRRSTS